MKNKSKGAIRLQTWRDRKRSIGLCTRCGHSPIFKNKSKCFECLRIAASEMVEYRERRLKLKRAFYKEYIHDLKRKETTSTT